MKADRPLWIDERGRLCDAPPTAGRKIAAAAGGLIDQHFVNMFGLKEVDGRVTQNGKPPLSPVSTPPPMIADRELFVDRDGVLHDRPQPTGIKLADEGGEVPVEYQREYGLAVDDEGHVVQKRRPEAPNKARKGVEDKGVTVTPPEGVEPAPPNLDRPQRARRSRRAR